MKQEDAQSQSSASGEEEDGVVLLPSFNQELATLAVCKRICEFYNDSIRIYQDLATVQRTVLLEE